MDNLERRNAILEILKSSYEPIPAKILAEKFNVTRQIIVSDIGILRANGNIIQAKKYGYIIYREDDLLTDSITVRHNKDDIEKEFDIILRNNGIIVDVIVTHPIYGDITCELNISNKDEARAFVNKAKVSRASQLSDLTDGCHIHTIKFKSQNDFENIINELKQANILL